MLLQQLLLLLQPASFSSPGWLGSFWEQTV
jgi:hypothetical protein